VTLILDRADYLEPDPSSWVVSIARQLIYGLPVDAGRTRLAVVTYGDNATVNFDLEKYSTTTDMINEMSFGYMGQRSHIQVRTRNASSTARCFDRYSVYFPSRCFPLFSFWVRALD